MLITFERLKPYFEKTPVTGVLHLGAHYAEELEGYESCGIDRVIWVEANTTLAVNLHNRTINSVGSSIILAAACDKDSELIELNVASNLESSSILDLEEHAIEYPDIKYVGKINTWAFTVDTMLKKKGYDRKLFNFANIDIQGAELLALKGMHEQLSYLDYVYLEVNEKHLYKDCALMPEIDSFLKPYGFERELTEITEYGWGDAFYVRKNEAK